MTAVRVSLPPHLERLARVSGEVSLAVGPSPTIADVLDALEERYPVLAGTVREHGAGERRAYIRIFACGRDLSHEPAGTRLPDEVVSGSESLKVVGAIAGG